MRIRVSPGTEPAFCSAPTLFGTALTTTGQTCRFGANASDSIADIDNRFGGHLRNSVDDDDGAF